MITDELYRILLYFIYAITAAAISMLFCIYWSKSPENNIASITAFSSLLTAVILFISICTIKTGLSLDLIPTFMIAINCIVMIIYLSLYFQPIKEGHVSDAYPWMGLFNVIIIGMQLLCMFWQMESSEDLVYSLRDITYNFLIIMSMINVVCILTIGLILKHYIVQG